MSSRRYHHGGNHHHTSIVPLLAVGTAAFAFAFTNTGNITTTAADPPCMHCGDDDLIVGEEEEGGGADHIPDYVPAHFKGELGGSLDHTARISREATYLLRSEAQYPVEKAVMTLAPDVPPPIRRQHPVHLVAEIYCTNKKMRISGSTKYEYWPFGASSLAKPIS